MMLISLQLFAQEDVATALYEEGVRKYILEDYPGALEDFEGALQLQPANERIIKMYLNTLIKQANREYGAGNLKGAEPYFLRAYNLSGGDEKIKANLETIRTQLELEEERQRTAGTPEKKDEMEKEKTVQLPFDMEAFIQQQNEQSRLLLDQMAERQRKEREYLLRNIEESQQRLGESLVSQREERNILYRNLVETRNSFDESLRVQQEERENLLQNLEENRDAFEKNIEAQQRERMALFTRIEENQRVLDESMRAQRAEREKLLQNMMEISRAQREDRRMFSRTLIILVGGSVLISLFVI